MPTCDHFRQWVLTDYIDGELADNVRRDMEGHLRTCRDCRAQAKEVKDSVVVPFTKASRQAVPAVIWERVKQNIEEKRAAHNPVEGFLDGLKNLWALSRLVPVFASLMLMFVAGSVAVHVLQTNRDKEKDQGEYLVALLDSPGPLAQTESNGFGTPIEHYFL